MKLQFICLLIVLVTCKVFGNESKVEKAFKQSELVPDILTKPPTEELEITYPKTSKKVNYGEEIMPKDVKDAPTVNYMADPDALYTLLMTDPDAPSRKNPAAREWQHWLIVNIPGSNVEKGETLTEYVGAGAPKGTGLHRYVFMLFKQPGKINFNEPRHSNTDPKRTRFSTTDFAKKYKLGDPVAGNFFEAQFDDSVPALHAQFH